MVVDPSSGNMSFPRENILSREKVGRADSVQRGSPFFLLDLFFLSCNFVHEFRTRVPFSGAVYPYYIIPFRYVIRNSIVFILETREEGQLGTTSRRGDPFPAGSLATSSQVGSRRTRGELVAPLPIPRSTSCFAREQGRGNESEAERGVIQFYKSPLLFSPPRYFE